MVMPTGSSNHYGITYIYRRTNHKIQEQQKWLMK